MTAAAHTRRNWGAINAVSVAKECSEAHVAFLIADAKADVADLLALQTELLEALEAAESHFGPFADITINGQHDPEDVRVIDLIRAAIAKAKETPNG